MKTRIQVGVRGQEGLWVFSVKRVPCIGETVALNSRFYEVIHVGTNLDTDEITLQVVQA